MVHVIRVIFTLNIRNCETESENSVHVQKENFEKPILSLDSDTSPSPLGERENKVSHAPYSDMYWSSDEEEDLREETLISEVIDEEALVVHPSEESEVLVKEIRSISNPTLPFSQKLELIHPFPISLPSFL